MPWAVIVVGVLVQVVVWRLVARDRLPFWPAVTTTFAVLGIGSLLAGDPGCCRETTPATASAVGVVLRTPAVRCDPSGRRSRRRDTTSSADPWRPCIGVRRRWAPWPSRSSRSRSPFPGRSCSGEVSSCPSSATSTSVALGAVLAWAAWVAVDATWGSIPLLAGAVVGGALWTGLATWSGGVAAPVASHLVWTGAHARVAALERRVTRCLRDLLLDRRPVGVGAGSVLSRGDGRAERPPLHAARVRLLGRPAVAHDLPPVGEDPIMEGRPLRGGPGAARGAGGHVRRHGEALRRAGSEHVGGRSRGGDLDRQSHRCVQQEERALLRRATPSTPSRCRSHGRRPAGCSSASSSSGRPSSTRTGCRRGRVGGAGRRRPTSTFRRSTRGRRPIGRAATRDQTASRARRATAP